MTELNKNSFFFYVMKKTGGLHDPAHLTKMIGLLKEWLPDNILEESQEHMSTPNSMDIEYKNAQYEYKQFLMENLK